ncbi:hypothetical protein ACROYT_G016476 [Oculina patagonica]
MILRLLQNNLIAGISNETFARPTKLSHLFLSANQLKSIPFRAFFTLHKLKIIMLSDNPIRTIEPEAFGSSSLSVYLLRTKLKKLSLESFAGLHGVHGQMIIENRTIVTLKYHFLGQDCTIYLNPTDSKTEAIKIKDPDESIRQFVNPALVAMGFRQIPDNQTDYVTFLPCPLGTFSNSSSRGAEGCTECLPGILNQRLKGLQQPA